KMSPPLSFFVKAAEPVTFEEARQKADNRGKNQPQPQVHCMEYYEGEELQHFEEGDYSLEYDCPGQEQVSDEQCNWEYTDEDIDALHEEIAELRLAMTQLKAENRQLSTSSTPYLNMMHYNESSRTIAEEDQEKLSPNELTPTPEPLIILVRVNRVLLKALIDPSSDVSIAPQGLQGILGGKPITHFGEGASQVSNQELVGISEVGLEIAEIRRLIFLYFTKQSSFGEHVQYDMTLAVSSMKHFENMIFDFQNHEVLLRGQRMDTCPRHVARWSAFP
ncbi:hypothetical protein AAVH_18588, partial [Aphelenchoides avenae]